MVDLPTVITAAGLQPQDPSALRAALVALVAKTNPGYTANLPAALVEDISSTDVGALTICDQARVDLVDSLTPLGANAWLLAQLGELLGTPQNAATTTSVYLVFSGSVGLVIGQGFTVSDGTYQYTVQDGGIIGSGGSSSPLFALATVTGSWAVPAGTVNQLVTSVPSGYTLTVTNPEPGTPAVGAETEAAYRARTAQGLLAASQGMTRYLRTLLAAVSGVQARLISARTPATGQWEVICGGGDPVAVAYAIFYALSDVSSLVGSQLLVSGITRANPGVVTTVNKHNYTTGQSVTLSGVNPSAYDGTYTVTVLTPYTFSLGVDTSGYAAYVSGGSCSPVLRNVTASVVDYPDTYVIPFVNPPLQTVTMTVTWNTTATGSVSAASVAQLAIPALVEYVNSVYVGQPMNLFVLQSVFQVAVESVIPIELLTRLVFAVDIDGVGVSPEVGTGIIAGDPESYFFATAAGIVVSQG